MESMTKDMFGKGFSEKILIWVIQGYTASQVFSLLIRVLILEVIL